jgi:hypothetical protein
MTLLAVTSGTATMLLWLALAGIVAAAVVLHWPRRFSGPLTEHERGLVRRVLRGRSLALTLATPALTVVGFVLLLPALVHLEVGSGGGEGSPSRCDAAGSRLSSVAWTQSTRPWVEAVECNAPSDASPEALAATIVETAVGGFRRSHRCNSRPLPAIDRASVELSLVELATRVYTLTEVDIETGPRHDDPDPWDVMKRTLDARGITTCRDARAAHTDGGELLRLSPAFVTNESSDHLLDVSALVRGRVCDSKFPGARLLTASGQVVARCELVVEPHECAADGERVVGMRVKCRELSAKTLRESGRKSGLRLNVGYDEVRVHLDLPVKLDFADPRIEQLFDSAVSHAPFRDALTQHGLRSPTRCRGCDDSSVRVETKGKDVVIEKAGTTQPDTSAVRDIVPLQPSRGPFSWQGVTIGEHVRIRCSDERVVVEGAAEFLGDPGAVRDPTVIYPLMSTIVWAANVLTNSACEVRPETSSTVGSRPLLTAEQLDVAVTGMRRGREALGLVCLGLALIALALGLRRSVS